MVFRFCKEPPLRAAAANMEEMQAYLRSLRSTGQLEEAGAEKYAFQVFEGASTQRG